MAADRPPGGPTPGLAGKVPSELAGGDTAAVCERSALGLMGIVELGTVTVGRYRVFADTVVVAPVCAALEQAEASRQQAMTAAPAASRAVCKGAWVMCP